jgi:Ca-activated chloride channel family protein
MTFGSPGLLFGLVLVPVVIAAYVWSRKRRRRRVAVLGAQGLVATTPARRRSIREHVPFALFALALAVLIVACARPMATVALPKKTATVVLDIDLSNSMAATDVHPSRIGVAKELASAFIRDQPSGVRIGVVGFGQTGVIVLTPTTDHTEALAAIAHLSLGGGTTIAAGILTALDTISGKTIKVNLADLNNDNSGNIDFGYYGDATVVLISDGEDTSQSDPATMARLASTAGIRIQTVGVGTVAGTTLQIDGFSIATAMNPETLENVAKVTNGAYHQLDNPSSVAAISKTINLHFKVVTEHTEITALFAMAGALLLALGAVFSLMWFGRVV